MKSITPSTSFVTNLYKLIIISLLILTASTTFAQTFTAADISGDGGDSLEVAMGDVNGDGFLDIYVVNSNAQNKLWINDGTGNFTANDINGDLISNFSEVDMGDVNGDGFLDIYISRQGQNILWINDGVGNFSTTTIPIMMSYTYTSALGDVNGDNHLDIFTVHMDDGPGINRLWINDGAGDFTPVEYGSFDSRGAVMGDLNNDGFLDIYLANVFGQNRILINDGSGNFTIDDISGGSGSTYNDPSIGDVNGDGFLDIYVANASDQQNKLWINDGTGNFTADDIAGDLGDSHGATMGDVNGDGFLDIYVVNLGQQNKLWINDGTGNFTADDIAGDLGYSFGAAMGDVNGDGFLDIYVANYTGQNRLWLQVPPTYTVRFLDHDNTVLNTQTATSGEDAVPPTNPTREGYTFTGWSPSDLTNITADTDFIAEYTLIPVSTGGSSGTSIKSRVSNLIARGEIEAAEAIIERNESVFSTSTDESINPTLDVIKSLQTQLQQLLKQFKDLTGRDFNTSPILPLRDLDLEDTGPDVTALQNLLINNQYSIPAGATGYFGIQTQSALANYQKDHNITPALGYFGPITQKYLKQTKVLGLWW